MCIVRILCSRMNILSLIFLKVFFHFNVCFIVRDFMGNSRNNSINLKSRLLHTVRFGCYIMDWPPEQK